ncbi:hypothetical protein VTN77DRAFT_4646 [Rasamsonia byssochlamydoides]|uniref:uncharacterized protein n=1 Tax=Rasamsonia byssochlamydoides TaxID=89139 RepID=UPI0037429ADB
MKTQILVFISKLSGRRPNSIWWRLFWALYFSFSLRRSRFRQNYVEAWRQHFPKYSLVIFVDQGSRLEIPCEDPAQADDAWLLRYLSTFYAVIKVESTILGAILPKELTRIDVVDLVQGLSAGQRHSTMDLGFYGYHRTGFIHKPSRLEGSRSLVDFLVQENVIRKVTTQPDDPGQILAEPG